MTNNEHTPTASTPTPTNHRLPLRRADFSTLVDALEYAAQGDSGYNFYDGKGGLHAVLSYRTLRDEARRLARRLSALGCERGEPVAIIADTDPAFHRFFFACQYAGLVPVALPAGIQLGARDAYVGQLRRLLQTCGARIAVSTESHQQFLREAAQPLTMRFIGTPDQFEHLPETDVPLQPLGAHEPAYLQYTSGSTQFPRGVNITQQSVLANLRDIAMHGLAMGQDDRMMAWLPFYHDMGLVGFVLLPLSCQLSADYLSPRTFAMRPRLWLKLLSENRGTISSSPPFGYELCAKRLRLSDHERYDLSAWRAACVGAERINPDPLRQFARLLEPSGFRQESFVACYGMAECSLAISFEKLNHGLRTDVVEKQPMILEGRAEPLLQEDATHDDSLVFVDCGKLLPSYSLAIRDDQGNELPERQCGRICLKGPSIMEGYYQNPEATREVLSADGWLDTGDLGYRIGDRVVVTARHKDLIIVNGRNIWPHDLEYLAQRLPGTRFGNASAFSAPRSPFADQEAEQAVIVVESKERNPARRREFVNELIALVQAHFGIRCHVDLVPPHTLPRTSSGKLSRSQARAQYFERMNAEASPFPPMAKITGERE
ncbi:MAG: fatty acyl-AMP ligase [Pseudomonadota bacterium]